MKSSSKTCCECQTEKPIEDFYSKGTSKYTGKTYFDSYCKPCAISKSSARGKTRVYSTEEKARKSRVSGEWHKGRRSNKETRHLSLWEDYRKSDQKKGRINDLTKDQVKDLLSKSCFYCEETENMSIDRIDNDLGHLLSNVNPSCMRCNLVRGDMPYEAWLTVTEGMKKARTMGQFSNWYPKRR